jgi:thiamine pyrophosphate-dependent acetolactate synthase large subunit-like protein
MFFVNSYADLGNRYVAATNENAALMMASGYASVTGKVGVATVTQMAVSVTIPALLEGMRGRTPLLLVAGDTPLVDKNGLQNIDQTTLIKSTGAGYEPVRAARTVVEDVRTAVRRAISERRPVVLSNPLDLQWQDVDYVTPLPVAVPGSAGAAPRREVEQAVGVIAAANRPLVLAGAGAATDEARRALVRLAERIGAPLATTLQAKELFHGEPFDIGICGTLAKPVALDVIAKADCVLAFGSSLNSKTTDNGELLAGSRVIQCDLDPTVFGRDCRIEAALFGDVAATADALVTVLDEAEVPASGFRSQSLAAQLSAQPAFEGGPRSTAPGTIHLRDVLEALDGMIADDRILTVDAGRYMIETLRGMPVQSPRQYVHTTHIGAIGMGLPAAIGAAIGDPSRPTLLVIGDGGFMFGGIAEFHTAVRNRLDLVVAVMNDGAYGAEHVAFTQRGMDPKITCNQWPDFEQVARALGGHAVTVRSVDDLEQARKVVAAKVRPVLIDFRLDPDSIPDPGFRRER